MQLGNPFVQIWKPYSVMKRIQEGWGRVKPADRDEIEEGRRKTEAGWMGSGGVWGLSERNASSGTEQGEQSRVKQRERCATTSRDALRPEAPVVTIQRISSYICPEQVLSWRQISLAVNHHLQSERIGINVKIDILTRELKGTMNEARCSTQNTHKCVIVMVPYTPTLADFFQVDIVFRELSAHTLCSLKKNLYPHIAPLTWLDVFKEAVCKDETKVRAERARENKGLINALAFVSRVDGAPAVPFCEVAKKECPERIVG
ncbi:hypothetical protein EDB89DRAFT_1964879 [Lactarius sanguifluus]|nr:hypothetical protein EDB89DRAFT_1964879 [Lactarius sanguifluus]